MNVLEIGCGDRPGPYFRGATEYVAVDSSEDAIHRAQAAATRISCIVGDAESLTMFDNGHFDLVIARNVYGDPSFGADKELYFNVLFGETNEQQQRELHESVDRKKTAITHESARLLGRLGSLVIIDEYAPEHAEGFLTKSIPTWGETFPLLTQPQRTPLAAMLPDTYTQSVGNAHTWVSSRK